MRVVAGKYGGRKLVAPKGESTRPTADRVKEALFSILGNIENASVLDLFSGTGALAFEALSRGARHAVLVEKKREALLAIEQNQNALGLQKNEVEILPLDVKRALGDLKKSGRRFDLIFADPPYEDAKEHFAEILPAAPELLEENGRLIFEHDLESLELETPSGLKFRQNRRYGDTILSFYEKQPSVSRT